MKSKNIREKERIVQKINSNQGERGKERVKSEINYFIMNDNNKKLEIKENNEFIFFYF